MNEKKDTIMKFSPLVLIIAIELGLMAFITFKYNQSNKEVTRNMESIRASYWASWHFGEQLARLERQVSDDIYLDNNDSDAIEEKLDFLMVSYEFLASDVNISPLLKAYAVETLQSDVTELDRLVLAVVASHEPIKQYKVILDVIKKLKLGYKSVVFFELKGSAFKVLTKDIEANQQYFLKIIYSVFLIVTFLLVAWAMTYLSFKRSQALSNMDALTLLPNRKRCVEFVRLKIDKKEPLCCFFIDLNGFKQINDTIGHLAGDEVLKVIAKRVLYSMSGNDLFARIGGDEFILILSDYQTSDNIEMIVERIINQIKQPINADGKVVNVGAAIGISFLSEQIDTVEKLFSTADAAMYEAKSLKQGSSSNYKYH
ncbi:GGDEF domain-containing protein [Moritella dasanensis]|uniref:GGDEF domain-containing protein n=1 Tax=Moritella dasanensis TaxID=428031 RepID=UPI0002E4B788|nr:GGDEF domain-containing protein [Moritella dasanensis]